MSEIVLVELICPSVLITSTLYAERQLRDAPPHRIFRQQQRRPAAESAEVWRLKWSPLPMNTPFTAWHKRTPEDRNGGTFTDLHTVFSKKMPAGTKQFQPAFPVVRPRPSSSSFLISAPFFLISTFSSPGYPHDSFCAFTISFPVSTLSSPVHPHFLFSTSTLPFPYSLNRSSGLHGVFSRDFYGKCRRAAP